MVTTINRERLYIRHESLAQREVRLYQALTRAASDLEPSTRPQTLAGLACLQQQQRTLQRAYLAWMEAATQLVLNHGQVPPEHLAQGALVTPDWD